MSLKDKFSKDKPWAALGISRKKWRSSRPWKAAGMSEAAFSALVLKMEPEALADLRDLAHAEMLTKAIFKI